MKYVIFDTPSGIETVRIFEELDKHSGIVLEVLGQFPGYTVKSAGTLTLAVDDDRIPFVHCVAKSVSLNIPYSTKQSEQDQELINKFFRLRI